MYNFGGEGESARGVNRKINYYTENNTNAEFQKPIFSAGVMHAIHITRPWVSEGFFY
jgi:hypothetical protein